MAAQDDVREREMRTLFNLTRAEDAGRADVDATLTLRDRSIPTELRDAQIPFELKSATSGKPTISTVRDLGLHHIEKWRTLHWLFGIYDRNAKGDLVLQYCLYGSPEAMRPWFDEQEAYVAHDVAMADHVPALIDARTLEAVVGTKRAYSREDARRLMKQQLSAEQYARAADLHDGRYSPTAMLALLRARCRYVIERGSTRNNPHIPPSYFAGWEQITEDHAARLRELVVDAIR